MEPMGDAGTSAGAETARSCLPWLQVTLRGDLQLEHGHLKARPRDSRSLEVGRAKEKVRSLPRSQHQNHHKTRKDRVECSPNICPRADPQEVLLVCRSGGRLPEAWGVSAGDAARGRWAGRGCVRGRFYAQLSKAGGGHLPHLESGPTPCPLGQNRASSRSWWKTTKKPGFEGSKRGAKSPLGP